MSTEPKKLALNLFEMACVSHITHGLWVLEDNNRDRYAGPLSVITRLMSMP